MNTRRRPAGVDFRRIQAHYDLGDDFFALFLDPLMTYSCALFDGPDTGLADAQMAKIDLSLGKCELRPGYRLLDIGCGWGATAVRAYDRYGAKVTGLTISEKQHTHDQKLAAGRTGLEFRLQGWEDFREKVDRIVSIGAFEHFGRTKYAAFFARCRELLPDDGVMLLHSITQGKPNEDWDFLRFVHFIATEIFPGGDVPPPELVIAEARMAGFEPVHVESLRPHYARTLDCWAANLRSRQAEATALAGEETFAKYMKYLTGCAAIFRSGEVNVHQFKLRVA
ncbi:MAG: class I SAM-dependent methyltransferase [Tepidisphaerales bacterium]